MKTYAAYYDNPLRLSSSSGGLFSAFASKFDVVYGVAMSEDCYRCEYLRVEGDISPLRGSKYIQANAGDTYKQVKRDLNEGKSVLFTGTGCQVNGLYHFLQKEYDNLFLLDVICHGVPSALLWMKYVKYREEKNGKINSINFRCKDNGWKDYGLKEDKHFISRDEDEYMKMFLRNLSLRPSCYDCYSKVYKKADVTLGDLWGVEDVAPEMDDGAGISLVIVRTTKGERVFESIKESLVYKEIRYEDGVRNNSAEYKSVVRPKQRDTFYEDVNCMTFYRLTCKYLKNTMLFKIIRKIKN